MHIPYEVLSAPVEIATGLAGAAGFGLGLRRLDRGPRPASPAMMGMMAAFVFAAQMVNFPLGPLPISGHLLGGVLAAVVLGPWAGAIVVGAVLIVQCFLFGDGALTALGANFVNMGLVGGVGGYAIYAPIRRAIGDRGGILIGAMVAAWFSVILSSLAFGVELALSGRAGNVPVVIGYIVLVHAAIGLGEALITGAVLRLVLLARPDLLDDSAELERTRGRGIVEAAVAGLAIALAVAAFAAPFASEHPDGLEKVGGWFGFVPEEGAEPPLPSPLAEYQLPGLGDWPRAATASAGVIGTLVVFGVGLLLARSVTRGERPGEPQHEAPAIG
ncbi:MAG: energy-coupling factor ABC transporter permease [Isosphaeraceae bacterium]